ncbi:hypothetical protein [Chloroflexus sp.]|uniref:hypothetical protein n=1 Tax=Chloroflexus sp. TaxID=1904827 RepID=UPI0026227614|nr:hypothetical protein [uncultured Chloroflexus sp.]
MIVRRLRVIILLWFALTCLPVLWGLPRVATAQPAVTLDLFTPFAGQYVTGAWLPLRIALQNQGASAVTVTVTAAPADEPAQYERTARLAAGTQQTFWLYVFIARPARAVIVTLSTENSVIAQREVLLLLRPVERMKAALGPVPAGGDLFAIGNLRVADLPDHPLGLSSLSVLALFALDEPLVAAQQSALLAWVYNGGHLIIGGGPNAIALQSALPPALRAATITGATILDRQPLVARGGEVLNQPLLGLQLQPVTGAQRSDHSAAPPWVELQAGHGRVTQLAFASEALDGWAGRERFWSELAQPVLLTPMPDGESAQMTTQQTQMLVPVLDALPQLEIPAFAQGVMGLTGYALAVIGLIGGFWWWRRVIPVAVLAVVAVISTSIGLWWANDNAVSAYSALRLTLIETLDEQQAQAQMALVLLSAMPRTETIAFSYPTIARPLVATTESGRQISGIDDRLPQPTTQINVELKPWHMQGLLATAVVPTPAIRAALIVDQGWMRVDVQNDSLATARDVFVIYGDQLFFFGTLRPGARSVGRWPLNPASAPAGLSPGQRVINDLRTNGWLFDRVGDPTARIRATLIDAAIAALPERFDPGPFMIAWLDQDPMTPEQSTTERIETLLVMRPPILGQGEINLGLGWLRLDLTNSTLLPCLNGQGAQFSGEIAEIRLRLPPALAALEARTIQVRLQSSDVGGNLPLTIAAYNWTTSAWDAIPVTVLSNITISNATPYLRAGELRLQARGELARLGCVVVTGGAQGVLP